MKKLLDVTKINRTLILGLTFIVSLSAQAKDTVVGTLSEVKGKVFVSRMGKIKEAAASDKIYDNSEIITELSSSVTLTDYYDHRFHLSGGAHLRVSDNQVELMRGYLWVQSFEPKMISEVSTANSRVYFKQAEAIISYDQSTSKTQMVVISGRAQFSHALESYRTTIVDEGRFSFIDNQVDDGTPRAATPIGFNSFQKMTELFDGVRPLTENNVIAAQNRARPAANRAPASVEPELENDIFAKKTAKTERAIVKEAVKVTNSDELLIEYYQDKIKEIKDKGTVSRKAGTRAPASVATSPRPAVVSGPVKVKIYGATKQAAQTPKATRSVSSVNRAPASVGGANVLAPNVNPDSFESRLVDEYARQTRHSDETLKLINDLKNYQVDFKKSY